MNKIKCFKDGDQYCALIGKDIQEGVAGFGINESSALKNLIEEVYKYHEERSYELIHALSETITALEAIDDDFEIVSSHTDIAREAIDNCKPILTGKPK